ncbi:MAG: type III pantothenate kinase [Pirellulaceae bacterium]|jgi:pantothenate kinase type III|nr:type III pantothenate kinase [Pirellulaceae bacterium]
MQQTFGVDIGNSGIRVAELDLRSRELGEMLRVDWCSADLNAVRRCDESSRRYLPEDRQWLRELDRYIESAEQSDSTLPARWLISSVRRDALRLLQDHLLQASLPETRFGPVRRRVDVVIHTALPLEVRVDYPQAVGIDRLLAALAALELTALRPAVVIQAGSAVTVDLITAPTGEPRQPASLGCFEGGAILPGVPMMLRLLGKGADMLPEIDAAELLGLPPLPGKNTESAMICGAASALVGGVLHLVERYRQQYGQAIPIIISGGDGMRLRSYVPAPLIVKDHLVHRGLLRLAELIT